MYDSEFCSINLQFDGNSRIQQITVGTGALHAGLIYHVPDNDNDDRFHPSGYVSKVLPYQPPIGLQSSTEATGATSGGLFEHLPNIISIMGLCDMANSPMMQRFYDRKLQKSYFLVRVGQRMTFVIIYEGKIPVCAPELLSLIENLQTPLFG
jgi:hypothetical protein